MGRLKHKIVPSPATLTLFEGTSEIRRNILKHLSASLRDNKEIVKLAVARRGRELEFASQRLQNDKEIVLQVRVVDVLNLKVIMCNIRIKNQKIKIDLCIFYRFIRTMMPLVGLLLRLREEV